MPLFTTDVLEYVQLVHRILRDTPPPPAIDAICFFGQTQENDRVALKAIAELWKKYQCPILVGACEPINQEPFVVRGSGAWVSDLVSYGVDPLSIEIYEMSKKLPASTDAEALGMAEFITREALRWDRLVVAVHPLHAVRAFVSLVAACKKNVLDGMRIWSVPSEALDWDEDVCYSGGALKATRVSHVGVDMTKMAAYALKGDHLTAREILEYLRKRNRPAITS